MVIIFNQTNFSILTLKSFVRFGVCVCVCVCVCLNHTALVFFSFDHFAALAIWYLIHGSPVCKLCLVQSSAEKKKSLFFDHELSMI